MRVIVVGCGRVGSALADRFCQKGHQVTVIDQNASAFDNLSVVFHGRTVEGDVLARNVMHRAEVESADALVAVTRSDSLNALVAHIARSEYHVPRVVARNFDPRQRPLQEAFNIPVVGSVGSGIQRIDDLISNGPLHAVLVDSGANLTIYRLQVPEEWQGHALQELIHPDAGQVLSWMRLGQPVLISSEQALQAGDLLYLSVDPENTEALRRRLDLTQERSE